MYYRAIQLFDGPAMIVDHMVGVVEYSSLDKVIFDYLTPEHNSPHTKNPNKSISGILISQGFIHVDLGYSKDKQGFTRIHRHN